MPRKVDATTSLLREPEVILLRRQLNCNRKMIEMVPMMENFIVKGAAKGWTPQRSVLEFRKKYEVQLEATRPKKHLPSPSSSALPGGRDVSSAAGGVDQAPPKVFNIADLPAIMETTPRDDLLWAIIHKNLDVSPMDAPSKMAWALLQTSRDNPDVERTLLQGFSRLITVGDEVAKDGFDDEGNINGGTPKLLLAMAQDATESAKRIETDWAALSVELSNSTQDRRRMESIGGYA